MTMDMKEFKAEPYAASRESVEREVGRPITDEEWTEFVNELFGAVDYYFDHNYGLLCDDIRKGILLSNEEDDEE